MAPLSGHFATLLRNTVQTLLADHDVCITDWHNARDVSSSLRVPLLLTTMSSISLIGCGFLGRERMSLAVCQPCVQVLAAAAIMAEADDAAQPRRA